MSEFEISHRIETIRRFSRFYTRRIGALREGLLKSPFGLTEARLIYELAFHQPITATGLTELLGLDDGYVSRLLGKLERSDIISRSPSPKDGRARLISLTDKGMEEFSFLNEASKTEIAQMLSLVSAPDQDALVDAMETVTRVLGGGEAAPGVVLRPPVAGDLGWVIQRHGQLYHHEYGWNLDFEGLVAGIVSAYVRDLKPERERCWIAEKDSRNVGCVFLIEKSKYVAQLRLLLVEPETRGLGVGTRLVRACSDFARQVGYRKITLWTNDILHAARKIYEREGYQLINEEKHTSFGNDLVGQVWELSL